MKSGTKKGQRLLVLLPRNNIKSDHHNSIIFQEQKNSEQSVAHLHKTPRCNFVQNIEMH